MIWFDHQGIMVYIALSFVSTKLEERHSFNIQK